MKTSFDFDAVNWAEVLAIAVVVAALLFLAVLMLRFFVLAQHARTRASLMEQNRKFLQSEYARLAGESAIYQEELRTLIGEVTGMAKVLKQAVASDEWDPEANLELLNAYDREVTELRRQSMLNLPTSHFGLAASPTA